MSRLSGLITQNLPTTSETIFPMLLFIFYPQFFSFMVRWLWGQSFEVEVLGWVFGVKFLYWWGSAPVVWGFLGYLGSGSLYKRMIINLGIKMVLSRNWSSLQLFYGLFVFTPMYLLLSLFSSIRFRFTITVFITWWCNIRPLLSSALFSRCINNGIKISTKDDSEISWDAVRHKISISTKPRDFRRLHKFRSYPLYESEPIDQSLYNSVWLCDSWVNFIINWSSVLTAKSSQWSLIYTINMKNQLSIDHPDPHIHLRLMIGILASLGLHFETFLIF